MHTLKRLFIFIALFITVTAWADLDPELLAAFEKQFPRVLVDVRGSRGGNGDVAAGYLTIMSLIKTYGVNNQIDVLADETSLKILQRLARGNTEFWNRVKVSNLTNLSQEPYDLYLALASPSGTFRYGGDIRERAETETTGTESASTETTAQKNAWKMGPPVGYRQPPASERKININSNAVLVVQTVLGNTENPLSINPHAVVRTNGLNFKMSPAGLGEQEAGIYEDYVGNELRDKSVEHINQYLMSQLLLIENTAARENLEGLLTGKYLKGARTGLLYGVSLPRVHLQFTNYLKGLDTNQSYCLITPSRVEITSIKDPKVQARVIITNDAAPLPEQAESGKIYIHKTATLPHPVFIGLTALSAAQEVVPLGAGDGFLSATLTMGSPFALTEVGWNSRNLQNVRKRLATITAGTSKAAINSVFASPPQLAKAQELAQAPEVFKRLSEQIPSLLENLINGVVYTQQAMNGEAIDASIIDKVSDPILRKSLIKGGTKTDLFRQKAGLVTDYLAKYLGAMSKSPTNFGFEMEYSGSMSSFYLLFDEGSSVSSPEQKAKVKAKMEKIIADSHKFPHESPPTSTHTHISPNTMIYFTGNLISKEESVDRMIDEDINSTFAGEKKSGTHSYNPAVLKKLFESIPKPKIKSPEIFEFKSAYLEMRDLQSKTDEYADILAKIYDKVFATKKFGLENPSDNLNKFKNIGSKMAFYNDIGAGTGIIYDAIREASLPDTASAQNSKPPNHFESCPTLLTPNPANDEPGTKK